MSLAPTAIQVVLYEGPGAAPLGDEERAAALRALLERGLPVSCPGQGRTLSTPAHGTVVVVGRFDDTATAARALEWPDAAVRWHQLGSEVGPLADAVLELADGAPAPGAWMPWFPVIDYDRCTHCMQCLSFCLFGVYGVDEEHHLRVQHQDQCKTLCPACSRVCPEAAIMFPKYKAGPINGEEVNEADLGRETMKVDISSLLGGDLYALLRTRQQRTQSRFSQERDADAALQERQRCLRQLGELAGDIPAEVLRSLPSPEEIARKAAEAAARATAARAASAARPE